MYPTAEEKDLFKVHSKYSYKCKQSTLLGKDTSVTVPVWRGSCPAELSSLQFSRALWDSIFSLLQVFLKQTGYF